MGRATPNLGSGTMGPMASALRKHPYAVTVGLLWVLPLVLMLVLHATLPDYNANGLPANGTSEPATDAGGHAPQG